MRIFIMLSITLTSIVLTGAVERAGWSRDQIVMEIIQKAKKHKIDPALALAIVEIESGFNPKALRPEKKLKTASVGLFQVLHTTAVGLGFRGTIEALKHPATNIQYGLRYLAMCQGSLKQVACCYQAGTAAMGKVCELEQIKKYHANLIQKHYYWEQMLGQKVAAQYFSSR